MRDGVRLHTLIFLPETEKKTYPVILMRTCYPAQDTVYRSHGEQLARRGFAYVCQYSRGREKSQGEWEPNVNERNDGTDTVDWLKDQEWCGEIGYWGYSYSSLAGWAMADAVEGKVNSMFLAHYGTDRFVSAYEKGEFRHDILTSWSMENTREPIDASYPKYIESCRYRPQTAHNRSQSDSGPGSHPTDKRNCDGTDWVCRPAFERGRRRRTDRES